MAASIARHKTALSRSELSRPLKLAIAGRLLHEGKKVFDYGCGLGGDLRQLQARGIQCSGWDPAHQPDASLEPADVVNLGYVVNVIEHPREREQALRNAWGLAGELLVVSARTEDELRDLRAGEEYSDGLVTRRNTFQKFYSQSQLKNWIDNTLEVASVPAALGVFFVFRDDAARESYVASRYRRSAALPRIRYSDQLYAEHEELLRPLMDFYAERGRVPQQQELAEGERLTDIFGSIKRAFLVIRRVTGEDQWATIRADRQQDLELYLALSRFDRRAKWSALPTALQLDVRDFFGHYSRACAAADELLFALGKPGTVDEACKTSTVGKLTPTALYVHQSALSHLSPLLRAFEGCGRGYLGEIDGANIIKLYRHEPKISYLSYPEFETDPHPALAQSLNIDLRSFRLKSRRYLNQPNPPILHRKETFLADDHALKGKFGRLTRAEEKAGLLDQTDIIGLAKGWEQVLVSKSVELRGHRLIKRRPPS